MVVLILGYALGAQKCIIAFEKLFLFWVPMNILKDWTAKLESAYSFMLKYSKITVYRFSKTAKNKFYLLLSEQRFEILALCTLC